MPYKVKIDKDLDYYEAGGGSSIVVSGNITAANGTYYINVANATYTDPSPVEGEGFEVLVVNGTATVGGVAYSIAGTTIKRYYHSGAWLSFAATNVNTYQDWIPSFTGFSANPTGFTARYSIGLDKTCHFYYDGGTGLGGTSNATTFTITLPLVSKKKTALTCLGRNNGTTVNATIITRANSNIADVYVSNSTGPTQAWTNSGVKDLYANGVYETV